MKGRAWNEAQENDKPTMVKQQQICYNKGNT